MSTKIYEAWRCSISKTSDTITAVRTQMYNMAIDRLEQLITCVKPELVGTCPPHFKDNGGEEIWLKSKKLDIVLEQVVEDAKAGQVSYFDIECGLNVWLYKNKAYFIPIAPRFMINELSLPDWCEEYGYWDNTDKPDDVSHNAWRARGNNWEKACLEDHNATRLYHEIINAKSKYNLFELRYKVALGDVYRFTNKL